MLLQGKWTVFPLEGAYGLKKFVLSHDKSECACLGQKKMDLAQLFANALVVVHQFVVPTYEINQ
jgi:hypothetical protein